MVPQSLPTSSKHSLIVKHSSNLHYNRLCAGTEALSHRGEGVVGMARGDGSQWARTLGTGVKAVGTAEKQQDQNKYGVWEHQDPGNPRDPPSSSSGARHAQGAAALVQFPPAAVLRRACTCVSIRPLASARVCVCVCLCVHTPGTRTRAIKLSPREEGDGRALTRPTRPLCPCGDLTPAPACLHPGPISAAGSTRVF